MSANPDWANATSGLGSDYHITRITFKNHGCCGHNFAALDAALTLKQKHGFTHKDIRKVRIATYQGGLDIVDNPQPEGAYQAKFSIQYTVAHVLVRGSVRLNAFLPDRLFDPDVRALMQRIECVADAELSKNFPRQRAARVEIELADGRKLAHFQPTRKGDPELPLSDAELNDKFLELAAPVLGRVNSRALLDRLWLLETEKSMEFDPGGRAPARVAS